MLDRAPRRRAIAFRWTTGGAARSSVALVEVHGDELVLDAQGADKIWALKCNLRIPLHDVVGAESSADEAGT